MLSTIELLFAYSLTIICVAPFALYHYAVTVGIPKWPKLNADRLYCDTCGNSFKNGAPLSTPGVSILALHHEAAHAREESPQLWPLPLPPRRYGPESIRPQASDIVLACGMTVRTYSVRK